MCWKDTCATCGKFTWAGWGLHIDNALREVDEQDRCPGWRTGKCTLVPAAAAAAAFNANTKFDGDKGRRRGRKRGEGGLGLPLPGPLGGGAGATRSSSVGNVCGDDGDDGHHKPIKYTCPDCGKKDIISSMCTFLILSLSQSNRLGTS